MSDAGYTTYKRDQVERAIAIVSDVSPQHEPKSFGSLAIELKRLLDQDRRQAREKGLEQPGHYAFHSGPPPGRGVDVSYTAYEAFALLIGLRLLRGGITQATAVDFLLRLRQALHACHDELLRQTPQQLRPDLTEAKRIGRLNAGFLIHEPRDMVYLVALAGGRAEAFDAPSPEDAPVSGNICRGMKDLLERMRWVSHRKHAAIVVELANAAHQLAYHLARIEPRSRGRQ